MEILNLGSDGVYEPKDWAWLVATFGPGLRLLDAGNVEKFELVKIVVTEAESSLNAHVLNEDGSPCWQQPVALSWPSLGTPADYLQDLRGGSLKSLWSTRGVMQYTGQDGQTGYGMSQTGWYVQDMAVGGPGTMWVLSPSIPSDGLTGLGMIGGTVHLAPTHLYFRITKPGVVVVPPGGDPGAPPASGDLGAILAELRGLRADLRQIYRVA